MPKRQHIDQARRVKTFGERQRESVADPEADEQHDVKPTEEGKAPIEVASRTGRAPSPASATAYVAVHLPRAEFTDAKAAYLADWQAGGEADTFARWIAGIVDRHSRRTPGEREALALDPSSGTDRVTRSFQVPAEVVTRMRSAVEDDRAADRWASESAWLREAIGAAVSAARDHSGGELPTPPARLPNRLIRAQKG